MSEISDRLYFKYSQDVLYIPIEEQKKYLYIDTGFITEWTLTTSSTTVTLPLTNNGTYNATVKWGDGTQSTITAYNSPNRTHSYAAAGVYKIEILGECPGWSFNNSGDKLKITDIISWGNPSKFGGFNNLTGGFFGCFNLKSTGKGSIVNKNITNLTNAFRACTRLQNIQSELFYNIINVTSFQATFYGCIDIKTIGDGLFDFNTKVAASGFYQTFYDCRNLLYIPNDLFKFNVLVSTNGFRDTFNRCAKITYIPAGLFDYNINVSTFGFYQTFYLCSALKIIPPGLFDYTNKVSTDGFYWCFRETNIEEIPAGLFDFVPLVSCGTAESATGAFRSTFEKCYKLKTVPSHLFSNCPNVTNNGFRSTFYDCTSLEYVPEDIFDGAPNVSSYGFRSTFLGSGLKTVPGNLFRYNPKPTIYGFYQIFERCNNLETVGEGLFDYATLASVWGFRQVFYECHKLEYVPELLFKNARGATTAGFLNLFTGCIKLTLNKWIFFAPGEETTRFVGISSQDFSNAFQREAFTGIPGEAPELWNCSFTNDPVKNFCFAGAGNNTTSLLNYLDIPDSWKSM